MTSSVRCMEKAQRDKKVVEKATAPPPQIPMESTEFQLIFLKDDEYPSVEVVEVQEIDFGEVIQRISQGESVFITRKHIREWGLNPSISENVRDPWYFTHM